MAVTVILSLSCNNRQNIHFRLSASLARRVRAWTVRRLTLPFVLIIPAYALLSLRIDEF